MRKSLVLAPTAGAFAMVFSRTASLLAISLTILSTQGRAQTQMVLVTTGSTMPEPLYVLWGDEYHKLHAETQLRYLPWGPAKVPKTFSPEPEILAAAMRPFRKAVESSGAPDSGIASVLVGIAVFYNFRVIWQASPFTAFRDGRIAAAKISVQERMFLALSLVPTGR